MAKEHELSDEGLLGLLQQEAWSLHKGMKDVDFEIAREIRGHSDGFKDSQSAIARIQELYEVKLELTYKAGRLALQMEQVEQRIQEREAPQRGQVPAQEGHREVPAAVEDRLDWLRPALDVTAEVTSLGEAEREPTRDGEAPVPTRQLTAEREEQPDWWPLRG
jgi:hypothetical protein